MGRKVSLRFFTVALAAGSLAMIPLSAPSGAATKVSCTKEVSGAPVSHGSGSTAYLTVKATLSGCSASVGGSGVSVSTIKGAKVTSKTTWAGGKGTSTQSVKYKAQTIGKCPAATTNRLLVTGTAIAGTGAALKVIPKGSIGKSFVCVNKKTSKGSLEPGTKATF
jgi:hypothetical protein